MKKVFLYLSFITIALAILPLPLAFLVDMTFHWLLIVTIPAGAILCIFFLIAWALVKNKNKK